MVETSIMVETYHPPCGTSYSATNFPIGPPVGIDSSDIAIATTIILLSYVHVLYWYTESIYLASSDDCAQDGDVVNLSAKSRHAWLAQSHAIDETRQKCF